MQHRYEKLREPRFLIETVEGVEQVRVKARRNWFVLPFLIVWLTFWTFGGIAAVTAFMADFSLFLLIWLVGWAFGWIFAASTIAWQLGGAEIVRVAHGDVEHVVRMPGYAKARIYRGSEVGPVQTNGSSLPFLFTGQGAYPPLFHLPFGSVKFRYGHRTIHLAAGLDEAEGEQIADWLNGRLSRA